MNNACRRYNKLIEQRGYLEYANRYHIHTLINVHDNRNERFIPLVRRLGIHGIEIQIEKIPVNDLAQVHDYNAKRKTKKNASGYYSDAYLTVTK